MLTRREFAQLATLTPLAMSQAIARAWAQVGRLGGGRHEVTLLYTNDFHSAFEPIPAYWLDGSPRLGGAAHLATLIQQERAAATTSFLLDAGDMFTGTLSYLTQGEALMELMTLLGYDAMGVGNHEFDYGWEVFDRQASRVPFPVLCCNVRYKAGRRFCQPSTILERNGVRLGVIGVMGLDAARQTIMPSKVAELEFVDPVAETAAHIAALRDTVDLIVVLAHQGPPGPMQTDAEHDPDVQRSLDADVAFCGAVSGIDVYVAAHSHRGVEQPIVHPKTGTLITQTYGYGTRLGRLQLRIENRAVVSHRGELLTVWSDRLPPHAGVTARMAHYTRAIAEQIGPPIGRATSRLTRRYHKESLLGNYVADVMRARVRADVAITNAGGLRADLPEGVLTRAHVLDALPFLNTIVALELRGADLREITEHGLSLERGMLQVGGLEARYDMTRPVGSRLRELRAAGKPVSDDAIYRVATNSFLAEGGDGYGAFRNGREVARDALISDAVIDHVRATGAIEPPAIGRLVQV